MPPERLKERRSAEIFGVEIALWERQLVLDRPFMARFGEIVRIEAACRAIVLSDGREVGPGKRGVHFDDRQPLEHGTGTDVDRLDVDRPPAPYPPVEVLRQPHRPSQPVH